MNLLKEISHLKAVLQSKGQNAVDEINKHCKPHKIQNQLIYSCFLRYNEQVH